MLKKLFIKNYKDTENPAVRIKYGLVAGVFGIITNVLLCILKMLIGIFTFSITIIADAVNNLTDAGSSIITLIGFKLSSRPADKEHPYGHARYENITALIVALIIFAVGIVFAKTCIEQIIGGAPKISISIWTFIILGIAILGKLYQMLVYLNFAKAIKSDALRATAADTRNDIISTTVTLIAMIIIYFTGVNIDSYAGLLVSAFIIFSGANMIKETVSPLLGIPPEEKTVENVKNIILAHEQIIGIHDLIIHNYGGGNSFASVHTEVNSLSNVVEVHDVIDNIEKEVYEKTGIKLSIHLDPVDVKNEKRLTYMSITEKVLKEYDERITFHDFRVVEGVTHSNLIFDIVQPYDLKIDLNKIKEMLSNAFSEYGTFYFVIDIDCSYC